MTIHKTWCVSYTELLSFKNFHQANAFFKFKSKYFQHKNSINNHPITTPTLITNNHPCSCPNFLFLLNTMIYHSPAYSRKKNQELHHRAWHQAPCGIIYKLLGGFWPKSHLSYYVSVQFLSDLISSLDHLFLAIQKQFMLLSCTPWSKSEVRETFSKICTDCFLCLIYIFAPKKHLR